MRTENWRSWVIGLVFGAASGLVVVAGGAPFLVIALAFLALAFVAARSIAFLSGTFLGVGGLWIALAVRAQVACDAFNARPNQGCEGFGVGQFLALSAVVLAVGLLLGMLAWRRRAGQVSTQTGS